MLEERYNNLMEGVEPSPELVQRTLKSDRVRRKQTGAWKPVLVIALCVVMVVGAAAWRVMNTGIIPPETASTNDTPTILPVSDELTLSVSDVTLVDEHKLSFILTVQGNLIDPQTRIDYDIEGIHKIHGSCYTLDPMPEQPDNVNRYQITLENKERPILLDAADTAELRIWRYTSGDTQSDQIHTVDWSTLPDTLPEECSPLIPLGGEVAVVGLSFSEEDGLTVLLRWPDTSLESTHGHPQLLLKESNDWPDDFIVWNTYQYVADGYIYHRTTFQVTRSELESLNLVTFTSLAGQEITGDWAITIDLTALTTD